MARAIKVTPRRFRGELWVPVPAALAALAAGERLRWVAAAGVLQLLPDDGQTYQVPAASTLAFVPHPDRRPRRRSTDAAPQA